MNIRHCNEQSHWSTNILEGETAIKWLHHSYFCYLAIQSVGKLSAIHSKAANLCFSMK